MKKKKLLTVARETNLISPNMHTTKCKWTPWKVLLFVNFPHLSLTASKEDRYVSLINKMPRLNYFYWVYMHGKQAKCSLLENDLFIIHLLFLKSTCKYWKYRIEIIHMFFSEFVQDLSQLAC